MPKSGGKHHFTGGWAPRDGMRLGETCRLCHQSWWRIGGSLIPAKHPVRTWLENGQDRTWRLEDFGPGYLLATDIGSPTGQHEWVRR